MPPPKFEFQSACSACGARYVENKPTCDCLANHRRMERLFLVYAATIITALLGVICTGIYKGLRP